MDLGGIEETWLGTGLEEKVVLLNLFHFGDSQIRKIQGDARDLSAFGDNSVDTIFSNSVIEHVGGFNEQAKMAKEVMRVAKNYWVQTPNKNFPVEIHFLFPFFQFLPKLIQKFIARNWPFSMAKTFGLDPMVELENLYLLNEKEIKKLFPCSRIIKEKLMFLTKSFIIVKK